MTNSYGFVTSPSTPTSVRLAALTAKGLEPAMGMTAYFDMTLDDGFTYRAFGTITSVKTSNRASEDPLITMTMANEREMSNIGTDVREIELTIEAVWKRAGNEGGWSQAGGALPTSPSIRTKVYISSAETTQEVLGDTLRECSYVGTYRDLRSEPIPLMIPGFSSRRGATHQAIIGRSGSGKTAFAHTLFFAQMRNESHAIVVIDPQGQWSSESGFLFSLQSAARALGRPVSVLRVSEDIRLPRNEELMAYMMDEMNLWGRMTRMGEENARSFSVEVAKQVIAGIAANQDAEERDLLMDALRTIVRSRSIFGRVYARSGDAGDSLKHLLCYMTGEPYYNKDGEEEVPEDEDVDDANSTFSSVMEVFTPLVNLFMSKNLSGNPRRPLSGPHGFLSDVLKVRASGEVAPYVVLDMSADTRNVARAEYARAVGVEDADPMSQMREVLDNTEVKAHIVSSVLTQIVKYAESIFNENSGNLDTQIVFDEAWRYAPNEGSVDRRGAIAKLSRKLAGWALDTRKYGVGWTYILQSPKDLNDTIRKQLTYLHVGHGIIGADRRVLDDFTSDPAKTRIYDQFADPSSTGVYPFMSIGPSDPLVFTATPTFFNVFSEVSRLLEANKEWIDGICDRKGLPRFVGNPSRIALGSSSDSSPRLRVSSSVVPPRARRANGPAIPSGVPAIESPSASRPPF